MKNGRYIEPAADVPIHKWERWTWLCFLSIILLPVCGGCEFFAKKPTEVESLRVLQELREVPENPHISNTLPDLYLQPPTRLEIKEGVKIFYFTKNHPAEYLSLLVQEQLGVKCNPHDATNQLVAYCADHAQADQVIGYLELIDVPPVQVNIDCLILERFGDITMDYETSLLIQGLTGEDITLGERLGLFFYKEEGGKYYGIQNGEILLLNPMDYPAIDFDSFAGGELLELAPAFPGASLRETERANFGADFGYWMDKWVPGEQVRTVVDVLVSQGYLKILLNPTLETVNGKQATVTIKDYTPIEKVKTGIGGASDAYNITEYVWVEDTLTVTPTVYADGSIGLSTSIRIGSRSKPEGVVQRSIITERSIRVDENRISPGESLVIGGMRKSEKRSVIRGVPFFKDIPVLGVFFSSKDFEEKGTEIVFILTPSISSGGMEYNEVVNEVRKKHEKPNYEMRLGKMLTDPYTEIVEQKATETESERLEAEAEKQQAQQRLDAEKQKVVETKAKAEELRKLAQDLQKEAEQAQVQLKNAMEEVKAVQQQQLADQDQAQVLSEKSKVARQEVQKYQTEADTVARQAAKAEQEVQQHQERMDKAQEALQKAQEELEKVRQQSESDPEAETD